VNSSPRFFSPNDGLMLTTSQDRTAKLWSAGSCECLCTLEGHRCGYLRGFGDGGVMILFNGLPAEFNGCPYYFALRSGDMIAMFFFNSFMFST